MKRNKWAILSVVGLLSLVQPLSAAGLNVQNLENILGMKGVTQDGEFKISVPQNDLNVTVDGFRIVPAMGLTTWIAFSSHGGHVMAMGDLVLAEDEVAPVEKAVIAQQLTFTALHNHFVQDANKVMFMHIGGAGDEEKVARSVRNILDKIRELHAAKHLTETPGQAQSTFDPKDIDAILGHSGKMSGGIYKIVIGRPNVQLTDGGPVDAFMGVNTWMAFQGTKEKAAVAGDFAMLENEVESVIRELVTHGIAVVALHNHMIGEQPRVVFLHFWGVDSPVNLARGLKAALDKTK